MNTFVDEEKDVPFIRRKYVFDVISQLRMPQSFRDRLNKAIEEIPQTTIFGYEIHELIVFAHACKEEGISKAELHDYVNNSRRAFELVVEENNRMMKSAFDLAMRIFPAKGENND